MTAVAVMILVDEGKISLDDPIEKYLPEFRGQMFVAEKDNEHIVLRKPKHPITVRETLNHTSGMPFKSAIEEPTLDGLSLASAVRSYAMTPLLSEPGTVYRYSNAGINTAARLIEVVAKVKYEDFMQQRLFDPLGMKDTTFWPSEAQSLRVAKSYRPDASKTNLAEFPVSQLIYPLSDRVHRFPMPAGGLFSTAVDTSLFAECCLIMVNLMASVILAKLLLRNYLRGKRLHWSRKVMDWDFQLAPIVMVMVVRMQPIWKFVRARV